MKEIIKASADWYFDGPGWVAMTTLAPLIGAVARVRPRFWWTIAGVVVVALPLGLLFVRNA